jgi:hypothetical protein
LKRCRYCPAEINAGIEPVQHETELANRFQVGRSARRFRIVSAAALLHSAHTAIGSVQTPRGIRADRDALFVSEPAANAATSAWTPLSPETNERRVMIPAVDDPKWDQFFAKLGKVTLKNLPAKMFMSRINLRVAMDRSDATRKSAIREAHEFFTKGQATLQDDIKAIFG